MRDDVRQSVFYVLGLPFWQVRVGRVQRAVRHAVQQLHKLVSLWAVPVLCVHYELQYGLPSLLGVSCGRIYFNCLHCYNRYRLWYVHPMRIWAVYLQGL